MKKIATKFGLSTLLMLALAGTAANAQDSTKDATFKPHGTLWGYAFGDYSYKAVSDNANRGGSNQYTGVAANSSNFQFRRIYLGYNYDISPKFSAELLLAAEDDFAAGDLLGNGKFGFYIKLANIRWKNIYPGADLVFGQVATPAFPLLSEKVWDYRSIERTVADIRRTPSFDMGVTLQGRFIPKDDRYGYNLMIGNGGSAKPETDKYKWFYGDVYAKLFNKHLIIDLYQDYEKLNWDAPTPTSGPRTHDRNMTKVFVAYTTPKFTVGVEAFHNMLLGDCLATRKSDGQKVYINTEATAISAYVRGRITKETLGFFVRYDNYNPTKYVSTQYTAYAASTSQYDPTNKEQFITYGLDWTPVKNVHIMPNVWMDTYKSADDLPAALKHTDGNDLVYRVTMYWIFRP